MFKGIRIGWGKLGPVSKGLLLFFGALQIPVLYLILNNIGCGFSLDRAMYEHLAQIKRVYEGNPIYVPMTFEFSAITYTPLYWWVCGWVWKLTGPGFFTPQLVSLLCSGALFYFTARFLWSNTSEDLFLTGFGLFCLSFVNLFTGFWLFNIGIDAMHYAFTVAGFFFLRRNDPKGVALAAACLSLGALTKQTGLAYVAAGAAYVLLAHPRRFPHYLVPAAVLCGGGLAYLQLSSGGLFYDIIVKFNRGPFWDGARLLNEVWGVQFLGQVALLFLLSLWPVFSSRSFSEAWKQLLSPEYVLAASGVVVACIAQPKFGSGNNHAVIALVGLVICGFRGLRQMVDRMKESKWADQTRNLFVVLQAATLLVPAWTQSHHRLIDRYDRHKYGQIAEVFKKGWTVMYHYPYITSSFGYPEGGHHGSEMCRWINGQWSYANKPDFLSAPYREQRFDYVILGASVVDQDDPTIKAILDNYAVVSTLPPHPTYPNTLMLRYPVFVLKAKRLGAR
ncbi:MAG: hypothetical protein EOM72_04545 [Opitutae bacterium]|nr:hypothetical protein [Opitutae bacterium]